MLGATKSFGLLLVIVSVFALVNSQQVYAAPSTIPSSNMLDVPYQWQERYYYCGVASVQMALHYISGDVIPQNTLAGELQTQPEGTWPDMMPKPFHLRGYSVVEKSYTTVDLKKQNLRGYVSIIMIWLDLSRKTPHYVVVIGYNATGIFVDDPWRGERVFISNMMLSSLWVKHWTLEIPYQSGIYAVRVSVRPVTWSEGLLDGTQSSWISSLKPSVFYFKLGTTHTISLDKYFNSSEGVRYYASENTITITKQATYTIDYVKQHRLLVETIAGTNEEWFTSDQTATLGPYDEIVPVDDGTRYSFAGLLVDDDEQEGLSVTLHMDETHTVVVRYTTQYFLKVDSDCGDPTGEGWYTSGDAAPYSVTTPQGFLIRHVFVSWTGDASSSEPQGALVMTQPYMIEAEWRDDYSQLILVLTSSVAVVLAVVLITTKRGKRQQTSA